MVLALESLRKRFGFQVALADVSLHVEKGDCYGFLGPNGAGKTTTLRIALGLIRPDAGRVVVEGFDAARFPREARARMGGLIETPGFYPWMSGRKNLRILARMRGLDRKQAVREADRLLEDVGLTSAAKRAVGGYSQGMRQRLGIAQALLGDPAVVLLDEPTNGLDPEGIEEFRRLLRRRTREEGRTVLLSSHQLKELSDVCNRIGILRSGRLLVEGEKEALLTGGRDRYYLETDDLSAAIPVLTEIGVEVLAPEGERLVLAPGDVTPSAVTKALVTHELEVRELTPIRESLEDLYLRYSHAGPFATSVAADGGEATGRSPDPAPGAPAGRSAPRRPVLCAFRQELARTFSRPSAFVLLLLPAALAVYSVVSLAHQASAHAAAVAAGNLASTSRMSAFEVVARALEIALPLGALIVAGLASQSLAGDFSRGTLRNLVLTPVGRIRLALGKVLAVLLVALGCYVLVAGASVLAGSTRFPFHRVGEILPNGLVWIDKDAPGLLSPFLHMLPALVVPFLAYAAVGFFAGAITRGSASALATAVGGVVALDLVRELGRMYGFEGALLSTYFPSPLGDTSWTRQVLDLAQAPNSIPGGHVGGAVLVPLAWIVVAVAGSAFVLQRRSVP